MTEIPDLGGKITGVIGSFLILVVMLALAVSISPDAINYMHQLGTQMNASSNNLVKSLGQIFYDFAEVVWYGGLVGGAFGAVYSLVRRIF